MKKVKFDIQGMTCSSCQAHVEKAVNKLDGINLANVNLLSNNMIVEYDEKKLDNNKIINSIIDAGYGASIVLETKNDLKENNRNIDNKEAIKEMKKRLIISIVFWIPLMFVAMYHMIFELLNISIPEIIKEFLHGSENAIILAFTQILLLLPIIYVNRNYFIIGFKRLFKGTPNMDSLVAIGSFSAIIYGIYAMYMIGYGLGHGNIELVEKFLMENT